MVSHKLLKGRSHFVYYNLLQAHHGEMTHKYAFSLYICSGLDDFGYKNALYIKHSFFSTEVFKSNKL